MTEEMSQDAATESAQQEQQSTETKPTETVEFWRDKAKLQEKRAKENAAAALKLAEYEDRDKTETQRLAERAEAAEKRAAEIEGRALRLEIAAEKGLTPAQAKRLVGSSRDELEADADDLLETFKAPTSDAETAPSVAPDLDLGARGTATAQTDKAALFTKFLNSSAG